MIFQNYALFPHLSVRDNITFGMKVRKEEKSSWQPFFLFKVDSCEYGIRTNTVCAVWVGKVAGNEDLVGFRCV